MDHRPERACSLSVNNPHLENALLAAEGDVVADELPDLARLKRVQIEDAVYRKLDRLLPVSIHTLNY